MSLFFRQALRYVASFACRESPKQVSRCAVPLKNGGPSFDSVSGVSGVLHSPLENRQVFQKNGWNFSKEIPKSENVNTPYLKKQNLLSQITPSVISDTGKHFSKAIKPICNNGRNDATSLISTIKSAGIQITPKNTQAKAYSTNQSIANKVSPLGYFSGMSNARSLVRNNQPRRCLSHKFQKNPENYCKDIPSTSAGHAGCLVGPSGIYPAPEGYIKTWRNLSIYLCVPFIIAQSVNVFNNFEEPERPKFRKYTHMRIRNKKFPWCGGTDKTLFHNPHVNALPSGYEDDDD